MSSGNNQAIAFSFNKQWKNLQNRITSDRSRDRHSHEPRKYLPDTICNHSKSSDRFFVDGNIYSHINFQKS